jgi:hypothetical protein
MDIGSIFLILALLILVILFISRPFFERSTVEGDAMTMQEEHDYSSLLAERDRILNALQELDFDHVLGKIPTEDYPAQRNVLLKKGTEILKKLDEIQSPGLAGNGDELDARIEAAIARRRADAAHVDGKSAAQAVAVAAPPVDPDDDIEVLLANRRRQQKEKLGGFCPQCGGPVRKSDLFCPKCGAGLA